MDIAFALGLMIQSQCWQNVWFIRSFSHLLRKKSENLSVKKLKMWNEYLIQNENNLQLSSILSIILFIYSWSLNLDKEIF